MRKHLQALLARWGRQQRVVAPPRGATDDRRRPAARNLAEIARYSVLAGYCKHLKPGGNVLDLACGEGRLHHALDPACYSRYVGVDMSEAAIRLASAREDDKSSFVVENLNYYIPRERFDVIVFGDGLHRLPSPLAVLARYARYVRPQGAFLIAMPHQHGAIWSLLDGKYYTLDAVRIAHPAGGEWLCKAYRARSVPAGSGARRKSDEARPAR